MPSLFFSQSAVARVSGIESRFIERFEVWESVVMVVFEKGLALRPRFLSKKSFYADFVESRKNLARQIKITKQLFSETKYTARNIKNDHTYEVEVDNDNRIVCQCRDYRDQIQFMGRGVCKHGYAVLSYLGFNSMAEYVDRPVVLPQPKHWPSQNLETAELAPKGKATIVNNRSID